MDREMGNETEFDTRNGREMGNDTEFETRNGRKWDTKRYKKHHFSTINEKNRVKTGKNRGKITKKQEKTGKNRKLQEIQKHHLDEVPENGNEFSARFREMLKTETETMSSRMSRNDDSRAKTMYRPNPNAPSSPPCSKFGNAARWSCSRVKQDLSWLHAYGCSSCCTQTCLTTPHVI